MSKTVISRFREKKPPFYSYEVKTQVRQIFPRSVYWEALGAWLITFKICLKGQWEHYKNKRHAEDGCTRPFFATLIYTRRLMMQTQRE